MDLPPLFHIFAIIVPFTILSGLAYYFLLRSDGKISGNTLTLRSALFAFRHGLNVGIMWALAFGIDIYLNPYQSVVNSVFYTIELVVFLSKVTDGNQRYLHFAVATSSIVAVITNAIVQPFTCDRSTDMAMIVFAHEVLRYILSLMIF